MVPPDVAKISRISPVLAAFMFSGAKKRNTSR
jgi:hypothetical protein